MLRGLAALCVVFNHFGFFVPQRANEAVYQWVNPGDYGVFVFFIISGYIVPASLERNGSVRSFWVSRLFRLYPLYLFAVGLAVLLWIIHFGDLRGENAEPTTSVFSQLLMMSNVLGGKNLPNVVWSLSYEMIFYLLLTALFLARIHRRSSSYALVFGVAAVALGGLLPQAYFNGAVSSPRLIAGVTDLVVIAGLALVVVMRGLPRLAGAVLAAAVGLALLAFNGTWLHPWEALSILALMFTGTMLYRAERGQYPWRYAIAIAIAVLGMVVVAGLWHYRATGRGRRVHLGAELVPHGHAGWPDVRPGAGVPAHPMAAGPDLDWTDQLLGVPAASAAHRGLRSPVTGRTITTPLWPQLLVDAVFLVLLITMCSLTYLFVERPMQRAGRRLARWLDTRFGSDRPPGWTPAAAEPVLPATPRTVTGQPARSALTGTLRPDPYAPIGCRIWPSADHALITSGGRAGRTSTGGGCGTRPPASPARTPCWRMSAGG